MAQSPPRFQEDSGIVVVEAESADEPSIWQVDSTKANYTGKSYLNYRGNNLFNDPGNHRLTFELAITKTGTYRFQWRSLISEGSSNTEHNDSWLRFRDAADFYAEQNGDRLYPHGSGKTPNPNGAGKNGWFKVYQNTRNDWTWNTRTSDHDPHDIYVRFDSAGIYTVEISGRSRGHAIDRFVLYHQEVSSSTALNIALPESEQINTVNTSKTEILPLKIYPSLANEYVLVELPRAITAQVQMVDGVGRVVSTKTMNIQNNSLRLPIQHLSNGIYYVVIKTSQRYYQAKFIKQ